MTTYSYRQVKYRISKLEVPGHYAGWIFQCVAPDGALYGDTRQYEDEVAARVAAQVYILRGGGK